MVSTISKNKKLKYAAITAVVVLAIAYMYSGAEIKAVEGVLAALTAFFIGSAI